MIEAYIIHKDGRGELRKLPDDEPPEFIRVVMLDSIVPTNEVDARVEIEVIEVSVPNTGYRWVGKVNQFAWVYQLTEQQNDH